MSDSNIYNMNDRQLRNEVQLLRDELAIMKRKYEDIIYNLDTDNFSQRVVKQGKDMHTKIEQTADEISLQAEKVGENTKNLAKLKITAEEIQSEVFEENEDGTKTSRITQTAEKIESEVKKLTDADKELSSKITQTAGEIRSEIKSATDTINGKFDNYSTIEQTAKQISASVTETKEYAEEYVTDVLANGDYVTSATLQSQLNQSANGIYATVKETYETKSSANSSYSSLRSSISSVSIEADNISSRVEDLETFKSSTFTQTADGFLLDGEKSGFTGYIYLTDNAGNKKYTLSHDESQGFEQVMMMSAVGYNIPLVLGDSDSTVYIGWFGDDYIVATRKWVRDNAGSGGTAIAVFG